MGDQLPVPESAQQHGSPSPPALPDGVVAQRVRSYVCRGRFSDLTRSRLADLAPARALPPGPFEPPRVFGRSAPLVLEIGCGHGAAALAYVEHHPGHDLVAMDVHTPGLARMLAAAAARGVPNLRIETGDAAVFLETRVAPETFDAVHLFFPDPWRKNKHTKRRFVSAANLDLLATVLKPGGHVLVATDQDFYAAHVRDQVHRHPRFTVAPAQRPGWRPTAGFEAKGVAAGRAISELRLDLVV